MDVLFSQAMGWLAGLHFRFSLNQLVSEVQSSSSGELHKSQKVLLYRVAGASSTNIVALLFPTKILMKKVVDTNVSCWL